MAIFGDAFQQAHNNLLKKEEERQRIREEEIRRERLAALRAPATQPVQQSSSFSGIPLIGDEEQRALQRGTTRGGAPLPENTFLRGMSLLGDATLGRIGFAQESDPTATKALSRAIDTGANIATLGASHALQSKPDQPYQPISTGSDGLDTAANIVGTIGGYVGFGRSSGTLGTGRFIEQKVAQAAPTLPRFAQRAAGGAAEGLAAGIGEEFADYQHDFTGQDETIGQRLGNIALSTGLGGGISAVAEPIGKSLGNLMEKIKKPTQEATEKWSSDLLQRFRKTNADIEPTIDSSGGLGNSIDVNEVQKEIKFIDDLLAQKEIDIKSVLKSTEKDANNSYQSIRQAILKRGGVSPPRNGAFSAEYKESIPLLLKNNNGLPLDEMADELGMNVTDLLGSLGKKNVADYDRAVLKQLQQDPEYSALMQTKQELENALQEVAKPLQHYEPGRNVMGIVPFAKPKPYEASRADTASQIVTRATRERMPANEWLESLYQKFVDDLRGIKRFENDVEDVFGRPLKKGEKAYEQALNSRGSDMIARQILTDQLVDTTGQRVGSSLREILKPLPKGQLQRFEDYLTNRHAITRFDRGEKVYADHLQWTPEKGEAKLKELDAQFPMFAKMADELYGFQREVVNKWLVDTGLINKNVAEAWFEKNPHYIPNKRLFSDLEKRSKGISRTGKGYVNQKAPVKKYEKGGSQRKLISPVEAIIENVEAFVKAAKRNEAGQALVNTLRQSPDELKGWAEIVKKAPDKKVDVSNPDAIDDILTDINNDFDKALQVQRMDRDNIVRVMVDGEPVHLKVNDGMLLDALTALGPSGKHIVADTVGAVTQMFKMFTTGANPVFSITRNLPRDILQSYVQSRSEVNPVTFMRDLTSAFIDLVRPGSEAAKEYRGVGGGFTGSVSADINQLTRTKQQLMPHNQNVEATPVGRKLGELAGPLKQPVLKVWYKFWDVIDAMESAPRLAEFKRIKVKDPEAGIMRALHEANEISVNFKRRGSVGKEIDKFFPYFNAAIQGLDKLARTFKDDPAKAFTKAVMSISVPTIVLYAMNRDNPDYQQLSQVDKDNNWLLPKGDGTFWKIAKPRELATVFSALPERSLRDFADQDPEAWEKFSKQVIEAFLPPGLSGPAKDVLDEGLFSAGGGLLSDTIGAPIVDVEKNRNFMGAPIVPKNMESLPNPYQYDEQTTSLAKALGQLTNSSPKKIDYYMRQYGGGLAELAQPLMQPSTGGDTALARIGETLRKKVTADPVYSNDVTRRFYDKKEKLDQANAVFKQTGEKTPDYNESLRKQYNKAADRMGDLRKLARQAQDDERLSADVKKEKLRKLQKQTLEIARKFN